MTSTIRVSRWVGAVLFAIGVILWAGASPALASPFLVCDPYTVGQVDYFKVTMDATAPVNSPVYQVPLTTNFIVHYDLTAVSNGSHTVKLAACRAATVWNPEACSAETNFSFVRPAAGTAPATPANPALSGQ